MKLNKKAELFAAKITNHPLYRRKAENSFLYKKPAYLTSSAFSDIVLDVLADGKSYSTGNPILMNEIKLFVNKEIDNNPHLKSILNIYIAQANGDVQKFKSLIEYWYEDSMNRVSGWYKRQTTKVLFVIGFGLAMIFNVSTIDIVHKLSVNKDLREALANSASSYIENSNKSKRIQMPLMADLPDKESKEQKQALPKDSSENDLETGNLKSSISNVSEQINNSTDTALDKAHQQIYNIQKFYRDTLAEVNLAMGLGWDSSVLYKSFKKIAAKNKKDSIWIVDSNSLNCFNKALQSTFSTPLFNGYYISLSVIKKSLSRPSLLIGFIMTALAITLGAPFWFDLLNRFVNVRGGGNKPSEDSSSQPSTISTTQNINQKPSTNSFG